MFKEIIIIIGSLWVSLLGALGFTWQVEVPSQTETVQIQEISSPSATTSEGTIKVSIGKVTATPTGVTTTTDAVVSTTTPTTTAPATPDTPPVVITVKPSPIPQPEPQPTPSPTPAPTPEPHSIPAPVKQPEEIPLFKLTLKANNQEVESIEVEKGSQVTFNWSASGQETIRCTLYADYQGGLSSSGEYRNSGIKQVIASSDFTLRVDCAGDVTGNHVIKSIKVNVK